MSRIVYHARGTIKARLLRQKWGGELKLQIISLLTIAGLAIFVPCGQYYIRPFPYATIADIFLLFNF